MFSWGGSLSVPSISIDTKKERNPPAPPTPLDFPDYSPDSAAKSLNERSCDEVYKLLSSIKKPQDVSPAHLEALNLTTESNIPVTEIIPSGVLKTLPPYQWTDSPSAPEAPGTDEMPVPILMSNGSPFPNKERYDLLKEEILFDNDDAFRAVSRLPPHPGREKTKLTQSRKFWAGLDQVAQYWDTSLDKFFERPVVDDTSKEENEALDKMHLDDTPGAGKQSSVVQESENGSGAGYKPEDTSNEATQSPRMKKMYSGRRTGTGSECPEDAREETLRGFMEMVAWAFGCQSSIPNLPPRLQVKGMLFPARQSFVIARSPQDRQVARKGILEGPMVLVQCRGETSFHDENGPNGSRYMEVCDLLRETAAMLLFAQERAREGATETRPGEGKWWTTKPRWGGADNPGPEAETENTDKPKEAISDQDARFPNKRSKYDRSSLPFRRHGPSGSKKLSIIERWKILQPSPSLWDRKMRYTQIGKDKDSPVDNIFMVSSINHHFSIVHLRVHSNYLEWLTNGKGDFPDEPGDSTGIPWDVLQLRRTRWFDLFNPNDRLEGLNGLWALFSWLMR
ncbi:hypothetical protein AJ78_04767 [Emergomyces pasteurianus Ep9510]|uniref:Uncharacterized protein n=1 Tax=Emergomyces pasteurianus Ep9510 TaxID=1447872 RepID=A0A1J9PED1_9EURO|nr:hypothetical protein AJ78_04767 [Emergomyces pasteurianus Ep9510]